MTEDAKMDESKAEPEPGPEPDQDVGAAKPARDPGVSEDVWQELEIAKMLEEIERERIRQEEEDAKR